MSLTFSSLISTPASLAAWAITLAVISQLRQPEPSTLMFFMVMIITPTWTGDWKAADLRDSITGWANSKGP